MNSNFRKVKLGEVADINPVRKLPKNTVAPYVPMDIIVPFNRKINSFTFRPWKGSGQKFKNGDILLARITPCLENGKAIYVDFLSNNQIGFGSTEFIVIREKEGITNGLFLYYLIRTSEFRNYAIGRMEGTSGRQRVPASAVKNYEFYLPPLNYQEKCAGFLSLFDDKIELNQRMNQTLEEMARTIFKSWFVDFDPVRARAEGRDPGLPAEIADLFPDSFEDSPLGEIPRGWRVVPILEIAALLSGGTPKTSVPEYWDGNVYWVTAKDVSQKRSLYIIDTDKKITELGLENSSAKILPKNTVIVTARGTVGAYALLGKEMAMNQTNYGLVSQRENEEYFLFFMVVSILDELKRNAYGTIFDTITTRTFQNVKVLMPPTKLTRCFNDLVSPFFEKMLNNENENASLIELRDKLLPGLMNGSVHLRGD